MLFTWLLFFLIGNKLNMDAWYWVILTVWICAKTFSILFKTMKGDKNGEH